MSGKTELCIVPDCERQQHSQGLCQKCYQNALERIQKGHTTKAKLIKAGLMLPEKTRGRKPSTPFGKALAATRRK